MDPNTSAWCKEAQHRMIDLQLSNADIAKAIGYRREYVSAIVHGRAYSEKAVKQISSFLGIKAPAQNTLCS